MEAGKREQFASVPVLSVVLCGCGRADLADSVQSAVLWHSALPRDRIRLGYI